MRFLWLFAVSQLFSLDHFLLSVYAVRSNGEVVLDQNSDLSMTPGSCIKIITTAAALHLLGPEFRFTTELEYDGSIDEAHTLNGNLYIRGGGDPCLGSEKIPNAPGWEKQIEAWVQAVKDLGIRKIQGRVIGDASLWETALAVPSWSWEDLGNYYGAGASALSFHENSYSLVFKPASEVGKAAVILRTVPPQFETALQNEVTTGPKGSGDNACIYGSEFSLKQIVRGTIPAAVSEFAIRGAIPDPARYTAFLLTKKLKENGLAIGEQNVCSIGKRTAFHTTLSPTVREIAHLTNLHSVNLYAEHLIKKLGEISFNEGSTAAGTLAVSQFWRSQGIHLEGFKMVDGSGLSRQNLVTAKQFVSILQKMQKSSLFPLFLESLPKKMGVRAKSGSMTNIKGYVGYAGDIAFAAIVNQCSDSKIRNETLEKLLEKLDKLTKK